jgi:CBS domain containing-hemolysin-like protein
MELLVTVALLTLTGSFVCSLCEAALYAITPSRLELLRERGAAGAHRLARLRAGIEEPIAAILTINTITHTVGAAWCGAMVGDLYGSTAIGLFAAIFTLLVLLVTEIVPKSIGVRHADRIAPLVAWPIQGMIWSVWPVVKASRWLMRRLTGGREGEPTPSEDELVVMSRLAARGGRVRDQEMQWVENALRLDRVRAIDLMTPRPVVFTADAEARLGDLDRPAQTWIHSRVPLVEGGDRDRIVGLVFRREVVAALLEGRTDLTLAQLAHPIDRVPTTLPGHKLLERFIRGRRHMVAVLDEYGGLSGVVTLEDVLESLIGAEIVDEHDEVEDLQHFAREQARPVLEDVEELGPPGEGLAPPGR